MYERYCFASPNLQRGFAGKDYFYVFHKFSTHQTTSRGCEPMSVSEIVLRSAKIWENRPIESSAPNVSSHLPAHTNNLKSHKHCQLTATLPPFFQLETLCQTFLFYSYLFQCSLTPLAIMSKTLIDLPPELLLLILDALPISELVSCRRVS